MDVRKYPYEVTHEMIIQGIKELEEFNKQIK